MSDDRTIPTDEHPEVGWLWHIADPTRVNLARPMTIQWHGEPWTIAASNTVLVMRPGDFGFTPAHDPDFFAKVIDAPPMNAPLAFPLDEVRTLVAPPADTPPLPHCETCDDTGEADCDECEGTGWVECQCECGQMHDTACRVCEGHGWTPCACGRNRAAAIVPWRIGMGLFDRRVLAKAVPYLPAVPTATWQQDAPERAALLSAGEWRVFIMPLFQDHEYTIEHTIVFEPRVEVSAPAARSAD